MVFLAIVAAWFAVGAVAVYVLRRRGHDVFSWAILFVFLGPLAIPLAVSAHRHPPAEPDRPVHDGTLDILVGHDGSEAAAAALDAALAMFGSEVTSVTLAAVVDAEAASTVRGHATVRGAQERLEAAARHLTERVAAPVDTVVLHGEPAHALERFAAQHGYELIVAGSRGHGGTVLARGTVARTLACGTAVPVLIGPAVR